MNRLGPLKESSADASEWRSIIKRQEKLQKEFKPPNVHKKLAADIDNWKKMAMKKIEATCVEVLKDMQTRIKASHDHYTNHMSRIDKEIKERSRGKPSDRKIIDTVKRYLDKCEEQSYRVSSMRIEEEKSAYIGPIRVVTEEPTVSHGSSDRHAQRASVEFDDAQNGHHPQAAASYASPRLQQENLPKIAPTGRFAPMNSNPSHPLILVQHQGVDDDLQSLIKILKGLPPMDKIAMSGKCEVETAQMEEFLRREFGFENIANQEIVDGVRDFRLKKPIQQLDPNKTIYFPSKSSSSFAMTPEEVLAWQRTYYVYAPQAKPEITRAFLEKALQGKTGNGPDAFLMKFVVRVSTCPILMEFDAKVIRRPLGDDWPSLIKLVSVTGVDFACRKHDVNDVTTYIRNWRDIFQLDSRNGLPVYPNGRDFVIRPDAPKTDLDEARLLQDLRIMASIRLHACDQQKVQIVVETGIGLGVFAGSYLGIDDRVRKLSARAVRDVLEKYAPDFRYIIAVVFALPVFPSRSDPNGFETSVYKAFAEEFSNANYQGRIPVMIADQDMHRLAVSIARCGYRVSELNPADSHGVFGEYWQNRGPAVEEKLALTTLGLLVQHHRINPYVLDANKYRLI